jgi:NAD(P)-dependent dehydrogenase (short-subunit alcohol dehydrogenase family)
MDRNGRFDRQTAIITGSGSGIGRAAALRLAGEGANVLLFDVNEAGVVETAKQIEAAGKTCTSVVGSVAETADLAKLFKVATTTYGRIDILANVAGISAAKKQIVEEIDPESIDPLFRVNLLGAFTAIQHAVPVMKAQKYGRIVNVVSIAAIHASSPGNSIYAMSKGALAALSRQLVLELSRYGITCNALAPGLVLTPMLQKRQLAALDPKESFERLARQIPVGRLGEPEEIAAAIAFLASPEASYITGQTLVVDGGMTTTTLFD